MGKEINNIVYIKQATKEGFIPCEVGGVVDLNYPESKTRRGRVQENGKICPTLTTGNIPNVLENHTWEINNEKYSIRIRKLTPKECWRLMGFNDNDFKKAETVNSNTQLYKQAGNSIVKDVLVYIFAELFKDEYSLKPCYKCEYGCNKKYEKLQCKEYRKWIKEKRNEK